MPAPLWTSGLGKAPGSDVAETMVQPPPAMRADGEPTTLMPAWSPPPAAPPPPPPVPETMAIPARTSPPGAVAGGLQAELTIEAGPDAGHRHRASDHAVRMGRSPDNDVIFRDPATSGHHARLERRGDQFWIVDLGSTNGTFVNGEGIQEKQLNTGDRLTIGQNAVQFSLIGA
jgi:pSer/pThr/pTyr-binding forkhead associated (FHA) protein